MAVGGGQQLLPCGPATFPKHRVLPGNGKQNHIPGDWEEGLDESVLSTDFFKEMRKKKWVPNSITASLGALAGGLSYSHSIPIPMDAVPAQSHSGAGRKAPTNSSADTAAHGGSARKPLCCCNVLLVALCTLQTDLASRHCYPGILLQGSSRVFNTCQSHPALNAGPEVTI